MNAPDAERNPTSNPKTTDAESVTVLVVEDFDETRSTIRLLLEMLGYRVLEAADGLRAVEVTRRERPDLILMDIGLPLMDGIAATRVIREDRAFEELPIVAISAHATPEHRVRALAAGCNEYLTKPIDFHRLVGLVTGLTGPADIQSEEPRSATAKKKSA